MKPVAFVSPHEAITKRKVQILNFHSKFSLKISALQFNWFNKNYAHKFLIIEVQVQEYRKK